jgi:hypothetical protein
MYRFFGFFLRTFKLLSHLLTYYVILTYFHTFWVILRSLKLFWGPLGYLCGGRDEAEAPAGIWVYISIFQFFRVFMSIISIFKSSNTAAKRLPAGAEGARPRSGRRLTPKALGREAACLRAEARHQTTSIVSANPRQVLSNTLHYEKSSKHGRVAAVGVRRQPDGGEAASYLI